MSGIYAIKNTRNGKVYVGKSVDVQDRWCHHLRRLHRGLHVNHHLQNAWDKYGPSSFLLEVLEEAPRDKLPSLEETWMVRLSATDREHGYNLDLTTPSGKVMSPETRARIGAANRGKVRTEEMRAHMRSVKQGQGKGRVKSPQEIENMRAAHAHRAEKPEGYTWFRSPEGAAVLRDAGKRGAQRRWHKDTENGT